MRAKKMTIAFTLLFLTATMYGQTTDTILSETKVNNAWQNTSLAILNYDGGCNNTLAIYQNWNAFALAWVNSSKNVIKYNVAGKITERLFQYWDVATNTWLNSLRIGYSYATAGAQYTEVIQYWDNISNTWLNSNKDVLNFDSLGNFVYGVFSGYSNNSWVKQSRNIDRYNADNLLTRTRLDTWQSNAWENFNKTDYQYNKDGLLEKNLGYYWDTNLQAWIISNRQLFKYLQGSSSTISYLNQSYLNQNYFNGTWVNSLRQQTSYYNGGTYKSSVLQSWDNLKWVYIYRNKEDYYSDGSAHHTYFETWNSTTNTWNDLSRSTYTHNGCILQLSITSSAADDSKAKGVSDTRNFNTSNNKNSNTGNDHSWEIPFANNVKANGNILSFDQRFGNKVNYHIVLSSKTANKSISSNTTSNAAIQAKKLFSISPNPAKDYIIITPNTTATTADVMLKLYDLSGKLMMNKKLQNTGTQKINLPPLTKGMYMVTVTNGNNVENKMILVE